jgi:hypothetical protein
MNKSNSKRITNVNIGGGMKINYDGSSNDPTFYDFVDELKSVAELNEFQIQCEFGRSLMHGLHRKWNMLNSNSALGEIYCHQPLRCTSSHS